MADNLRWRYPKLSALLYEAAHDILAFIRFRKKPWPQLASTNSMKQLNKEIKRRSRVVDIFPNNAAILHLVGMLLAEQTDE